MEQRNVIFKGGKTGITSIEWLVFVDEQNIGKVNFSKDLSVNLNVGKHRIQYVWGVYKTNVLEINIISNNLIVECVYDGSINLPSFRVENVFTDSVHTVSDILPQNVENKIENQGSFDRNTTTVDSNIREEMYTENKVYKKNHKKQIICAISILCIALIAFIFTSYPKERQDSKNEKNISIETHNGYKTFDFTIEDILEAYSLDIKDCAPFSTSPYCQANPGTMQLELSEKKRENYPVSFKYSNAMIVYEIESRKVMLIDIAVDDFAFVAIKSDFNLWNNDAATLEKARDATYASMINILSRVNKSYDFFMDLSSSKKAKLLEATENGEKIIVGKCIIENNIGFVQCPSETVNWGISIRADDEDNFYKLNSKLLTNRICDAISIRNDITVDEYLESSQDTNTNITGIQQKIEDNILENNEEKINLTEGTAQNITPSSYGKAVTNYNAGGYKWEIFYADADNIYLISKDAVKNDSLVHTKNNPKYSKGSELLSDNVTYPSAKKWLAGYINSGYNSIDNNMKGTLYLLDSTQWKAYDDGKNVEWVIGGPTIELLYASINATLGTNHKIEIYNSCGYGRETVFDKHIFGTVYSRNEKYWIAGPTADYDRLFCVNSDDTSQNIAVYISDGICKCTYDSSLGFRPVICLNSSVALELNSDGNSYSIK